MAATKKPNTAEEKTVDTKAFTDMIPQYTDGIKDKNIYGRLAAAKAILGQCKFEKSGASKLKNGEIKFRYMQLGDFLPVVKQVVFDCGLEYHYTDFTKDKCGITFVNIDQPDETLTMSITPERASVYQADAIQNMGAEITYLRRYLIIAALDLIEDDQVDATRYDQPTGRGQQQKPSVIQATHIAPSTPSEAYKIVANTGKYAGKTMEQILKVDLEYIKALATGSGKFWDITAQLILDDIDQSQQEAVQAEDVDQAAEAEAAEEGFVSDEEAARLLDEEFKREMEKEAKGNGMHDFAKED